MLSASYAYLALLSNHCASGSSGTRVSLKPVTSGTLASSGTAFALDSGHLNRGNGGGFVLQEHAHFMPGHSLFPCLWNTGYRMLLTPCILVCGNCQVNVWPGFILLYRWVSGANTFSLAGGTLVILGPIPLSSLAIDLIGSVLFAGRLTSEPRGLLLFVIVEKRFEKGHWNGP